MKKRGGIVFTIILVFVILSSISLADFDLGDENYAVDDVYYSGESIRGWINISFDDEKANSIIKSSGDFDGEIKLIDFLEDNNANYECVPEDCNKNYEKSNSASSKSFSLNYDSEKIIGIYLTGKIKSIDDLNFKVSASNSDSCMSPLEIDILNDDESEWKSTIMTSIYSCTVDNGKGCFDSSKTLETVYLSTTPYCEKISLPESDKYYIGAWIQKNSDSITWNSSLVKMNLYSLSGTKLVSCNLNQEPSSSGGEVGCYVNYSNDKIKDYYVCIEASKSNIKYSIQKEKNSYNDSCGFYSEPDDIGDVTSFYDYNIFAKGGGFGNIGIFVFNNTEYENQDNSGELTEYIKEYLDDRFNLDCEDGCIIPIAFKAFTDISITVSDLSLSYSTSGGQGAPITSIYDCEEEDAKLSSNYTKLDLSLSNITVPDKSNDYTFKLYLDSTKILQKDIEVITGGNIEKINPTTAAEGVATIFSIKIANFSNIKSYEWNFGDNAKTTTTSNSATHTYNQSGTYSLTIKVTTTSGGSSTKTFTVNVKTAKEAANYTIQNYKDKLDSLSLSVQNITGWYKEYIKEKIDLDSLTQTVNNLETRYLGASSNTEYKDIMNDLVDLNIPSSIYKSGSGKIPYLVNYEDVNLDNLKELGAGTYSSSQNLDYKKAVASWTDENLKLNLDFSYITIDYDSASLILGTYELILNNLGDYDKEIYIVINSQNIKFNEDYNSVNVGSDTGIVLSNLKDKTIKFISESDLNELKIYMSPKFSYLPTSDMGNICDADNICENENGEDWKNCREDCKPWGIVSVIILIILIAALIVFIFLKWWYKYKYETHLFPNRDDIFNILNFINNAQKQGLSDKDVLSKLKTTGWSGEQIKYVLKKYKRNTSLAEKVLNPKKLT